MARNKITLLFLYQFYYTKVAAKCQLLALLFQKSKGETSCKFATYSDISTVLVAISSPDMLRFVFNPFSLFFQNFSVENI